METWALRMCLLEMALARRIELLVRAGNYHILPRGSMYMLRQIGVRCYVSE